MCDQIAVQEFANRLTKEKIIKACVDNGYYRTPHCNEKLYLHFRGYDKIDGLEEYVNVKVLWLEGNSLHRIEGLDTLTDLRCLYLHQNCIHEVQGLSKLTKLDTLNLSDNYIEDLGQGLEAQKDSLSSLQIKNNKIATVESLSILPQMQKLSCVDLQGNKLTDGDRLLELLGSMPNLRTLYLTGNPCVRTIPHYRKKVISSIKHLCHLDDKPVFADERRLVTAWTEGGIEAERAEKKKMKEEEEAAHQKKMEAFRRFMKGDEITESESDSCSDKTLGESDDEMVDDSKNATEARDDSEKIEEPMVEKKEAVDKMKAAPAASHVDPNPTNVPLEDEDEVWVP